MQVRTLKIIFIELNVKLLENLVMAEKAGLDPEKTTIKNDLGSQSAK